MKIESGYTYSLNRECPCGKAIPDQFHKATKYCPPFIDANGKKIVHKDIFTADQKKQKNLPYKSIFLFHKRTHQNLICLWRKKSKDKNVQSVVVSLEELKAYNINITRPVQFQIKQNNKIVVYFIEFAIEQIDSSSFKLYKHELRY